MELSRGLQKSLTTGALMLGLGAATSPAVRAQTFTLTDIGVVNSVSGGVANTAPFGGINSLGQVAATATLPYTYTTSGGTVVNTTYQNAFNTGANGANFNNLGAGTGTPNATSGLPPSSTAYGINDSGTVVGRTSVTGTFNNPTYGPVNYTNINHAYRLNSSTETGISTVDDLGTLGLVDYRNSNNTNSPNASQANGINAAGQIVGSSQGGVNGTVALNNPFHAFRINANESALSAADDLGALVAGGSSNGMAISSLGQVVGFGSTATPNFTHAFRLGLNETTLSAADDLGVLGTSTFQGVTTSTSFAYGINTSGQVVGTSSVSTSTQNHAFRSSANSAGAVTLTDLSLNNQVGLSTGSVALGIDTAGNVVGYDTLNSGINHAFFYTGTTMYDLNNLLASNANGVVLNVAYGITDNGKIMAYGTQNGVVHGYVVSAVNPAAAAPEPASLLLLLPGLGAGGALLRRRKA